MMKFFTLFFCAGFFLLSKAEAFAPELQPCLQDHQACIQTCKTLDSAGSQAACVTKCAGTQARCAGQVGLGTSKPFLDQKLEQLDGFLNEFLQDVLPLPGDTTPPSPDTSEQNT